MYKSCALFIDDGACACLCTSGVAALRQDKHTPARRTAVGKVRTEAALPAEPLGQASAFTVSLPFPVRFCRSVATTHLLYHFLAHLSYIAPFVPTPEIVE